MYGGAREIARGVARVSDVIIAVLATLDSKAAEAEFLCAALLRAGVRPWLLDLSLRPHERGEPSITENQVSGGTAAQAAGSSWPALAEMDRTRAAEVMIGGAGKILLERAEGNGSAIAIGGAIGLGGANGTSMACALMRTLPPLMPKVMVSVVAATAAVEWYVAESDIAMFPSIGDISLNRITRGVIENASHAVAAMALGRADANRAAHDDQPPLIGVSSFGGTAACIDRVTERLTGAGFEIIHFHASGPGGRALESLARRGELAGVVDVTTHELTDLLVDGVYSAGDGRLRAAGEAGIPQVVVPGALDHANFWVGRVPERYKDRAFFQYNAQNILMRTNGDEFAALGRLMAERLNAARGPVGVLVPTRGYSEHTKRTTHDLEGRELGPWAQPDVDAVFAKTLAANLEHADIRELDLHINDPAFGDACADAFLAMIPARERAEAKAT